VPYSDTAPELDDLDRELRNLEPVKGRFDLVTLAGNHIYDAGETGVRDTTAWLRENGVPYVGGGMNLEEAERPLVLERQGIRFGFLNYNCTGIKAMNAGKNKAGGAFVDVVTHYELGNVANPGGPPDHIFSFPEWSSFERMTGQIAALREQCDIVCVYLHKGIVHKPVALADYERFISRAAIDAGADVVFGSHSHILHGVEVYKGRTIFHGLNNLIAWVPSLSPNWKRGKGKATEVFDPEEWARRRIERFGFVPDPEYPTYPFHPESIYSIIAKCEIEDKKIVRTGFIPMIVGKTGIPEIVGNDERGARVLAYMEKITRGAGLNARFEWSGDEILIV
jgi:poly-gamma-glutamate synthesis protein (capsule biosynthesis protein)